MNTATIPVYNSEVSRPKNRGRDLAFGQSMLIAGVAISYWFGMSQFSTEQTSYITYLDYGLSFINSDVNWRLPIAFQSVFALVLIMVLIDLPGSYYAFVYGFS